MLYRPDAELPPIEDLLEKIQLTPEAEALALEEWDKTASGKYKNILRAEIDEPA